VVDVKTGKLVNSPSIDSSVDLEGAAPSASPRPGGLPADDVYALANAIAIAPDSGFVYASVSVSEGQADNWTIGNREWMIPVRRGVPGTPARVSPAASLDPEGWCPGRPSFVDTELMVQVCTPIAGQAPGNAYYVRRVTTAGESPGDLPIPGQPPDGSYPVTAVVDRAGRVAFVWDPVSHRMTRVGIDDGTVHTGTVNAAYLPDDRLPGNERYIGADPGLAVAPDGRRLYALGLGAGAGQAGASTGVWVFNAATLNVIGHWEPRAFLISLAVSADGRFVYVAGAAGFDVEGRENPWPASVTVYDAATGEVQVLYGAVARDTWVSFPTWP
jgi:hypothetical protein